MRSINRWLLTGGLAALVVPLIPGNPANASTVSCGDVITTDLVLEADLVDCPTAGLIAGASGITIDLNGHTIDGSQPSVYTGGSGVLVAAPHGDVTIKNGTIQEFAFGVEFGFSDDNNVRHVRLADNLIGIEVGNGEGNVVRSSRFDDNRDVGIRLFGADNTTVLFNRISGGRWGVILQVDADDNRIVANRVTGDERSISRGVQIGLESDGNLVAANRVRGYGEYGISMTETTADTKVVLNRVSANGIHGVYVDPTATDTSIVLNRVSRNAVDGIHVDDGSVNTTIAINRANHNGAWGIAAFGDVVDGGCNRARGNGEPDQCVGVVCR